jgi:hypothetical protein
MKASTSIVLPIAITGFIVASLFLSCLGYLGQLDILLLNLRSPK